MSTTEEKIQELESKIDLLKFWIRHSYESQEKEQKAINVADKLLIDIKSTLEQVVKETKKNHHCKHCTYTPPKRDEEHNPKTCGICIGAENYRLGKKVL